MYSWALLDNDNEPMELNAPLGSFADAVGDALDENGRSDSFAIYELEGATIRGPNHEVAYFDARGDGDTLWISDRDFWDAFVNTARSDRLHGIYVRVAPDAMPDVEVQSATTVRGFPYPTRLRSLPNFADTSYGNDLVDSVHWSAADGRVYHLWITAPRVLDRPIDIVETGNHRFMLLASGPDGEELEEAFSNVYQAGDPIADTDDVGALMRVVDREMAQHGGRGAVGGPPPRRSQTATSLSPRPSQEPVTEDARLLRELRELGTYHGWTVLYEYPGYFEYKHRESPHTILFTPDHERTGTLAIDVQDDDGTHYEGVTRPLPKLGRTGKLLFDLVKPFLDQYQPLVDEEDAMVQRFRQLDTGPARGPKAVEEVPGAERFKLLELNPPRVARAQKIVTRLQKEPAAPSFPAGSVVTGPNDLMIGLVDYIGSNADEYFVMIFVNIRNQVIGYAEFTSGDMSGVQVSPSGIFRAALAAGAAAVITAHQHPSGDPTPSDDDRQLWARIRAAGQLIGIPILDNLVIGEEHYFSEEEGSRSRIPYEVLREAHSRPKAKAAEARR